MKLKIKDLLIAKESLFTLGRINIPAKAAYIVARNSRKINVELDSFEEARKKLIETYEGKPQEDGNVEFPSKEIEMKANEEFQELVNTEVEVEIRKLAEGDLGNSLIPPASLTGIWWMLEE